MLTVVKVGGGLARELGEGALYRLCRTIGEVASAHPLLIVPGGGEFADVVREYDRRFQLSPASSHHMALLAMDQFGTVLRELIPGAKVCARPAEAAGRAAGGHPAVLQPVAKAVAAGVLPSSWEVTSDSIALWAASAAGAGRAVLVKAVDGLYRGWPARGRPRARLTAAELGLLQEQGMCTGVDRYLPVALRSTGVEAWVVGGGHPRRLIELLERGSTVGTRLTA